MNDLINELAMYNQLYNLTGRMPSDYWRVLDELMMLMQIDNLLNGKEK